MSILQHTTFYTSVNRLHDLPSHAGIEVAFAGRSNAGKSSAINTLTNRGRLAFVSKSPGRTQLINFFQLGDDRFLVDLPGYGYAKVPFAIRRHWQDLLSTYLQTRKTLFGLVLIMDVRHPLKPLDIQMLDWFAPTGKSVHILLTKADKLSRQQANNTLREVRAYLLNSYPQCSVQLFSSLSAKGIDETMIVLNNWFGISSASENKTSETK
ncbi:cell division checkpoint GTPase YihA [Nitrosomonas cryotolerans]|uniref:Probable GTP-binding protein EngB n=1 Tax=Nitrosomonas cryotolerans ATCC 49181 TaxID=1131553 RepID=A0A1N6HLI3_9PROT|nr:ribosome biogenesis GTP-binding protein YihA/YsxC [Nitrosomonas cryotolerans]SFP64512.1 cell division checkpoint GTPase YihA [Nitrosomonas cryotolerans]SIO20505.1 cell division checkpoint GTPase YihA [Nitrosomonas cryotolerans ATCC 49181]